ncbi:MAG: ATP-binding protein [Bacteroidota bacterium]
MKLRQNKKPVVVFLLFAVFLLAQILLEYYYKQQLKEEVIVEKLERYTQKTRTLLEQNVHYLSEADSSELNHFFKQQSRNLFNETQTEYSFYVNGKLSGWSDNRIAIPDSYDSATFDAPFEKLGNAYCLVAKEVNGDSVIIGLNVLKRNYPYENQNLKNDFNDQINIPDAVKFSDDSAAHAIKADGEELFSVLVPDEMSLNPSQNNWLFVLFSLALLFFLIFLYQAHRLLNPFPSKPRLYLLFYGLDLLILRGLISWLNLPLWRDNSLLFDPSVLGLGSLLPSLGDMFFTSMFLMAFLYAVYKDLIMRLPIKAHYNAILVNTFSYLLLFLSLFSVHWLLRSVVLDSSVMLNLHKVFAVDFYTIITFLSLFFFITALYLLVVKILRFVSTYNNFYQALLSILLAASMIVVANLFVDCIGWPVFAVSLALLCLFTVEKYSLKSLTTVGSLMINLLIFAGLITFLLQFHNQKKEEERRKVGAVKIASKQDPVAESMFLEIEEQIYKDDTLKILIQQQPMDESLIVSYIQHKYFNGYWDKYNFQTTVCRPTDNLVIGREENQINCDTFFTNMINESGHFTFSNKLFYLDNSPWFSSYLARLSFPEHARDGFASFNLYIEMTAKFAPEGLVYPELLISDNIQRSQLFSPEYSLARYDNNELVASIGEYSYVMDLQDFGSQHLQSKHFFSKNNYSHYVYPVDDQDVLVVSKKVPGFWESLAPFAYIFIFLVLVLAIVSISLDPSMLKKFNRNFKNRLQAALFMIILFSFVLIGVLSVDYLKNINEDKNNKQLKEKSHSILIEVEHKLLNEERIDSSLYPYINDLMFKFASVFFSDINMYDTSGMLIATSRPEIYNKGLVSEQMNSEVIYQMKEQQKTVFLHQENLGDLEYSSAYMPFRNTHNDVVAYLNIPYYAKQSEMEEEITGFLATFINIYVFLLAISISIALLLTSYITRPLNLIKQQMRRIKLGASNEKIVWENRDEIGELINEYNKMIDELERSADLLVRSQRESAWREMAKQVAHEIKNPLTPMKLNVQMLQRSYKAKDPNWENKLVRVTDSLVEQIDNLAAIATEFSDFAKMPVSNPREVDVKDVIAHSIELYSNYDHVRITSRNNAENTMVKADYKQLTRVFNNILDNAVQAIPKDKDGWIEIELSGENGRLLVSIKDNGQGIPVEMRNKIFSPSFTTKSSGMGLGLTMVKSILQNAGGKIWFQSIENQGTTFYIEIPQIKQ